MKIEEKGDSKALRLVQAAPELTKQEEQEINGLFPAYIFRVRRDRELWTTCCREHHKIAKGHETYAEQKVLDAEHTPEPKFRYGNQVNRSPFPTPCPYCGRLCAVKELGRTGSRGNLSSYRRVVVLKWHRSSLWARAYECAKHYNTDESRLCNPPGMGLVGVYRFRPGSAEQAIRGYYWWGHTFGDFCFHQQTGPLKKGKWELTRQFSYSNECGMGYKTIGVGELGKSPFQYCCGPDYIGKHYESLRFLTACCIYPRQIEMLMKAGMQSVVADLVEHGVKNSLAFKWEETDPFKGFGLTKQELREFMATKRDIDTIRLFKQLRRMGEQVSIAQCEQILTDLYMQDRQWIADAKHWGLRPMQLYRYFQRQNQNAGAAMSAWHDYINCAQKLGYPLHRSNVLLPPDLGEAHDDAAEKHRRQLQRQRDLAEKERLRSEKERLRLMELAYEERRKELERKYAVELDGYTIVVPKGSQEIMDEGRILKHCVAGYADRHMQGLVTILFMRETAAPDKPFLTIEMAGNRLVQIHGYRNEGLYSAKGRFAPDPREEHREWLDTWLDWLKKGSKRDKEGKPVLPRKKKRGNVA